jgi:putative ABC transport system permease protein
MTHDLRQAFRTLVRHPGFLVLSAGVLALGIGLNTALFSIVHAMLFRTYPVASSHELVSIYQSPRRQPNRPFAMSSDVAEHLARHGGVFTSVTGHLNGSYALRAHEQVDTVRSESVLANYFDVLGVPALLGRTFIPAEDDRATTDRAVVLSHRLWQRRFTADPGVVGQQVKLALWGQPELVYTIVGVAPETFRGISTPWQPTDLWVTFAQNGRDLRGRGLYSVIPIGRLKPGVTLEQARAVISAQGKHHYYSRINADADYEP